MSATTLPREVTMKAVKMYAPADLRFEDAAIPSIASDEVLVKVMAVGVCGSDIPRANVYGAHVSPIILGHEFSGEIVEVGSIVKNHRAGDRVVVVPLIPCFKCHWCRQGQYSLCEDYDYYGSRRDGAMAEFVAVKESNLLALPDNVTYEDGATTDPFANALHSMRRAGFDRPDTFCAYGAGPIGLFAIQYAKIAGSKEIIAVDVLDEKLDLARKAGADIVINSTKADAVEAILEATQGRGTDVVIDFSGIPSAQLQSIRSASKMGRVVFLGISHKGLDLTEKDVDLIMRKQLDVRGSWNSFTDPFPGPDWTDSLELFEKRGLTASDIISHRLTLEEVPEIFRRIRKEKFFFSKLMIYPNGY